MSDWISANEQAKMIRAELKRHFPGVTFWVRQNPPSGIDIHYDGLDLHTPEGEGFSCYCRSSTGPIGVKYVGDSCKTCGRRPEWQEVYKVGAPALADVKRVVNAFSGGGFDGMVDLPYSTETYLDADNHVVGTVSGGTGGSMGSVPAWDRPSAQAVRKVQFSADYINASNEPPWDHEGETAADRTRRGFPDGAPERLPELDFSDLLSDDREDEARAAAADLVEVDGLPMFASAPSFAPSAEDFAAFLTEEGWTLAAPAPLAARALSPGVCAHCGRHRADLVERNGRWYGRICLKESGKARSASTAFGGARRG